MTEEEITKEKQTESEEENVPKVVDETGEVLEAELVDDTGEELEAELIDEIELLTEELQSWQVKAEEYLDGWQRARAEFANYKKRVEREQSQAYQNASVSIFRRYLDVLDDLDRALKNPPQDSDGAAWASGIELVYRKFYAILESEGVTIMEAEDQDFDPNLHEAISQEENDQYESGQIIEVVKNGYLLGDKVLRAAMVRVAK